jgi:hypothetical protein
MSEFLRLFPLNAFMAWTGTILSMGNRLQIVIPILSRELLSWCLTS